MTDVSAGRTLSEYCEAFEVSPASVWQRIRRGELISRTLDGRLKIFERGVDPTPLERSFGATAFGPSDDSDHTLQGLPDLPIMEENDTSDANAKLPTVQNSNVTVLESFAPNNTEIALLLDHLSIAKEENKEILRMTQDSIAKITAISEQLAETKDQMIDDQRRMLAEKDLVVDVLQEKMDAMRLELSRLKEVQSAESKEIEEIEDQYLKREKKLENSLKAKDKKIEELHDKLENVNQNLLKLKQDYEDLEMLAKTLSKNS